MPDIFDQITEPAKGGDIFDQITSVEDVGGEKLTPETEAAIKRDEEAVNLREPRTGLREGIERLTQTPLARKILGPSALEREAMVGSTGSPGEIVSTALKFATVPEPVREAIRPVVEAPIQWLPIPEPVKAALLAPQRLALETPLAPIPAGMGKPVVAAFAAQTLANLPEQKAAYDAALARGDVTEAVKIGSSVALATGLIAAGGAIEGVRPKAPIETLVDRIAETAPVTAKVIEQTIKPESEVPSASSIEKAAEVYANVPAQPRPGEGQMPIEISGEGVQPLRGGQPAQGGAVRPQGETQYPVEARPALTPEEAAIRAEVQEAGFSTREAVAQRELWFHSARDNLQAVLDSGQLKGGAAQVSKGEPFVNPPKEGNIDLIFSSTKATGPGQPVEWSEQLVSGLAPVNLTDASIDILARDSSGNMASVKDLYLSGIKTVKELKAAGKQRLEAKPEKPAEIVGMGGATPAEFQPARQTATGIKNAAVDAERQARGQQPILAPERLRNPVVWDKAMAKIDTDPAWQDRLIAELQESPRTPSAEEIVALDHRYVDLQNEYAKATRDGAQHFADGYMEGVKEATERATFYESQLGQLEQVARKVGTEWGRSGQMRQRLMREDFSLAAMEAKMRAAKGFEPLTEQEHAEIGDLATKLEKAEQAAEQSERTTPRARTGGLGPDAARKRGEVDIIKQRFERKLVEERLKRLTRADKIWTGSKEALNLSRSILTSWDLSAVFRQGGFIALGNPVRAARAMGPMFKALASEKAAAAIEAEILSRPKANLYKQGDLFLAPREGGKLTGLEEAFMSRIATRIPGVAGSSRAYVTFLNRLRADTFDALHDSLVSIKGGEAPTIHELKAIGNYINVATGRGNLGKAAAAAETLSTVFFAPRLVASRFQLVAGQPFYRGSHATRQLIAKEYGKFLAGLATIYGLGMMAGATVENDPRSTEFGKLKFGNTRVDPMSGLSQVTVLLSRLASGEIKNAHGRFDSIRGDVRYGHRTAADVIATFLRTKLSPVIGTSVDILTGKNVVGEEVTPGRVAQNLAVPISFQDIYDVMREQGIPAGTAMAILAVFGMNVQTYQTGKKPK